MNIDTGEIRAYNDLTKEDIESKNWLRISEEKLKTLEEYESAQKRVDLSARSPLSNMARNKRKKKKKMSQKSRVKNRGK